MQIRRNILIFLGIAVLFLLSEFGTMWYLYSRVSQIAGEMHNAQAQIVSLTTQERELADTKRSLAGFQTTADRLEKVFITQDNFADFVKLLERLARDTNISFQAQQAELTSSSGRAKLGFALRGSFSSIVKFLILLDNLPYSGMIDEISLTSNTDRAHSVQGSGYYSIFTVLP